MVPSEGTNPGVQDQAHPAERLVEVLKKVRVQPPKTQATKTAPEETGHPSQPVTSKGADLQQQARAAGFPGEPLRHLQREAILLQLLQNLSKGTPANLFSDTRAKDTTGPVFLTKVMLNPQQDANKNDH